MQHAFDISIATKYGVNVAIFLNHLSFWVKHSIVNLTKFHKGKDNIETFWTYDSQPALLKHFPYWSIQTLKTTIKSCKDNDLILIDNFNDKKYDKKGWYALTEKGLSLFEGLKNLHSEAVLEKNSSKINIGGNQLIHKLKSTDASVKINRPIADNNPDNKTDNKSFYKKTNKQKHHFAEKMTSLPIKSTIRFWEPGNPDYDRVNGIN